jgi:hypothetical protein
MTKENEIVVNSNGATITLNLNDYSAIKELHNINLLDETLKLLDLTPESKINNP